MKNKLYEDYEEFVSFAGRMMLCKNYDKAIESYQTAIKKIEKKGFDHIKDHQEELYNIECKLRLAEVNKYAAEKNFNELAGSADKAIRLWDDFKGNFLKKRKVLDHLIIMKEYGNKKS